MKGKFNILNGAYAVKLWNNGNYNDLDAGAIIKRLSDHIEESDNYKILSESDIDKLKNIDENVCDRMRDKYKIQ